MLQDIIKKYNELKLAFFNGTASDDDCELLQDLSLILQSKGLDI